MAAGRKLMFRLPELEARYMRFNEWVDQRVDYIPSFLESVELVSRRLPARMPRRRLPIQTLIRCPGEKPKYLVSTRRCERGKRGLR